MLRIISFDEFVKSPKGTVFWEFEPEIFVNLSVFVEPIYIEERVSDFWYMPLTPWRVFPQDHDEPFQFGDSMTRWACYDESAQFCVLDDDDVELFKDRLSGCLE